MKNKDKKRLSMKMISLRRLAKISLGSLSSNPEESEWKRKMEELLREKGLVYAYFDKKEMVGCFLFSKETALLPSADMEPEQVLRLVKEKISGHGKDENRKEKEGEKSVEKEADTAQQAADISESGTKVEEKPQNVYRLVESLVLPDYEEQREEMKNVILTDLKERIQLEDCQGILWEGEVIQKKKVRIGSVSYAVGLMFGIAMGVLFGIIFDNMGLGICFGVSFGICMGMVFME